LRGGRSSQEVIVYSVADEAWCTRVIVLSENEGASVGARTSSALTGRAVDVAFATEGIRR